MIEDGLGRSLDAAGGAGFIEARSGALPRRHGPPFRILRQRKALAPQSDQRFAAMARLLPKSVTPDLPPEMLMLGVTVQPDGQPIPDPIPRWQNISRPAAVIEDIRRQVALSPPRILILQQNGSDNAKLHVAAGVKLVACQPSI